MGSKLDSEQLQAFERDGFVILKNHFDEEEVDLLLRIGKADKALLDDAKNRKDTQGNLTRLTVRNELSDDLYSAIARCHRVVDPMEQVLGGEVYHYHHKMMLKEPRVGGAWEWHQDYGYWYENGCLYPYMGSFLIAIDRATKENGCLQVIRGSHHIGRVDHGKAGGQIGADRERVEEALKRLELVYVELDPGDALVFHGNLLHRSDMNRSEYPRWSLICCYNAARNDPYKKHHHPNYTPLEKLDDAQVKAIGRRQWDGMQARLNP